MGAQTLLPENFLSVVRGTSKTLRLTVVDGDGSPVDLTNATVFMTVKQDPQDHAPLIYKTSDTSSQAVIDDPLAGLAKIFIDPLDTQNMEIGQYAFDVWAILASGKRYCVIPQSVFELLPGVTVVPL